MDYVSDLFWLGCFFCCTSHSSVSDADVKKNAISGRPYITCIPTSLDHLCHITSQNVYPKAGNNARISHSRFIERILMYSPIEAKNNSMSLDQCA